MHIEINNFENWYNISPSEASELKQQISTGVDGIIEKARNINDKLVARLLLTEIKLYQYERR